MADHVPELVPVGMLTRYVYCRRLGYIEWVQNEFQYNADVVEGEYRHRNVDVPKGSKKLADSKDLGETIHTNSVLLSDAGLGLVAKTDMLQLRGNVAVPVEYKKGKAPEGDRRVQENYAVQLCAQGLLLRASGYECDRGLVYYAASKKRVEVAFDEELVGSTMSYLREMRQMASGGRIPAPLIDSPKCPRCSLVEICLPDEVNAMSGDRAGAGADGVRRMYPMRSDAVPLYVDEQGAYVAKYGDCLHVKIDGKVAKRVRLIDVSEVTLRGNVQISTQAVRQLCERGIPVCYTSYAGRFVGMTSGAMSKNVDLRMAQFRAHENPAARMSVARQIVFGKVKNCATMLRRNGRGVPEEVLSRLESMAGQARGMRGYEALLGVEGLAARTYFGEFSSMLRSEGVDFDFRGRNRRPPMDPVNAVLSYLYGMLARQAEITAARVGFDPYLGFLHMPKYGKPSLALDLMEEFRPLVADSACVTAINNGEIGVSDFVRTRFGVSLKGEGRRAVILAYERRMDSSVRHPALGYSASYRRILETQARLLARHLAGEIPSYRAFRTR